MTDLEQLIKIAQTLSDRLDKAAQDEAKFGVDISMYLERMSWEMLRTKNDLQEIRNNLY